VSADGAVDLLSLLEEIQAIARTGLAYTSDPYDRERCGRLLALACQYYGTALALPPADVRARLSGELGYITPKVGADAAIFDGEGRILLVKRADDGRWCLPCGWVEPNESPAETAVRETFEETGLQVRVLRLVDVFARRANSGHGPHSAVAVVYLCEAVGGALRVSHESLDLGYQAIEEVSDWHELHERYARAAAAVREFERDHRRG
jgi:ADP-ribose pyrophosphatase YjhB (NUDIX family)